MEEKIEANNWILDEVIKTVHHHYDNKDELIKQLTIQKIQYGRACLNQFVAQNEISNNAFKYFKRLDAKLANRIKEIAG